MARVPRITRGDLNPVGMIASSMLTEVQFQALNGPSWILADGRSVAGSFYATVTGFSIVPDLRGQFIRGKNNGRIDGNQDPDGERALGAWQANAVVPHDHSLANHQHISPLGVQHNAGFPWQYGISGVTYSSSNLQYGVGGSFANLPTLANNGSGALSSPSSGNTGMFGSAETRPNNMATNIFIKIN